MNQIRTGQVIDTRFGPLTLESQLVGGRDGQLWRATLGSQPEGNRSLYFAFLPLPHAEAECLERIRHLTPIASAGWATPDSIVRSPATGTAIVYRFQRESTIADAVTSGMFENREAGLAFCARLCDALAHLHARGMHHGTVTDEVILVSTGCQPLVLDAPVGPAVASQSSARTDGSRPDSAVDIRAVAGLVGRLKVQSAGKARGQHGHAATDELDRVLIKAAAAGGPNGYVQVCELRDDLAALTRPTAASPRRFWPAALAAGLLIMSGLSFLAFSLGRQDGLARQQRAAEFESDAKQRLAAAESRVADLEKQSEVHRSLVKAVRDDLLFARNGQSLGSNTIAAWSSLEMLLWPLTGNDSRSSERRLEFLEDRLTVTKRFVDDAYTRGNEHHLETMLAELSIGVWEVQAGRLDRARIYLDRVVPNLENSLSASDPMLLGARQLSEMVSDRPSPTGAASGHQLEPWVRNLLGFGPVPPAPGEARVIGILEALESPELADRNKEFTRRMMERRMPPSASASTP